jgi:hypothetical protein
MDRLTPQVGHLNFCNRFMESAVFGFYIQQIIPLRLEQRHIWLGLFC